MCPGCQTQAFLECTCPPGYLAAAGEHRASCSHADLDAQVTCPPGSDCCAEDHDHAAAANACAGGHDGVSCPEPDACAVWKGATADASHPLFDENHPLFGGNDPGGCPGGHCHKDVKGCGVCRPLVITVLPGTQIQTAGA